MKLSNHRTADVLILETMAGRGIEHTEQTDSLIAPFGQGQWLILEILDASDVCRWQPVKR